MSVATIGSALVEKRRDFGLAKGQAADKIGVSRTTYSSYEQDAQRPSVDVFPALAEFLDIAIEELLALYGATCVTIVRSSLERVMLNPQGGSEETESSEELPSAIEEPARAQSETSYAMLTKAPDVVESISNVATSDVAESEESQASEELLESAEVREEQPVPFERRAYLEEPAIVGSVAFEPTPFTVKVPKSESGEKSSGHKKKKKKKQKKKN
jgi:transcriptional regulator with XRE-family HTH domain